MTAAEKKEHQELLEKLAHLEQSNGELKLQLAQAHSAIEQKEAEVAQVLATKEQQEKESLELIQELQEKADLKVAKAAVGHTAKISVAGQEDRVFKFTSGSFTYQTVKYKSSEIQDNDPILVELVKIGAGIIQEVK